MSVHEVFVLSSTFLCASTVKQLIGCKQMSAHKWSPFKCIRLLCETYFLAAVVMLCSVSTRKSVMQFIAQAMIDGKHRMTWKKTLTWDDVNIDIAPKPKL